MSRSTVQSSISRESTVNDVLLSHPESVAVFNTFGIDACCGGDASLAVAAERDGADLDALLAALDAAIAPAAGTRSR